MKRSSLITVALAIMVTLCLVRMNPLFAGGITFAVVIIGYLIIGITHNQQSND